MKMKLALSLLAVAVLPACSNVKSTSTTTDYKSSRYAAATSVEPAPPAEGPTVDIPGAGPADLANNPGFMPSPLLRGSAAGSP